MQQSYPPYGQQMPPQANAQYQQVGAQHALQSAYYPYHDQYYYQYGAPEYGYPPQGPAIQPSPSTGVSSWFDFSNSGYVKGFLIGAGVTLLVTNPTIQNALIKGTVKLWSFFQGGVEEVKEKIQDIKAEMGQEKE